MEKGVIRVLPPEIVGKIAAGEVVERPASVVKELIENSIDAGARSIEIEIKDGGQKLIEITDDGAGMIRDDAVLAFNPHATSKIVSDEQLEDLSTLGFRGEALATIAAVSRVTMLTKHSSSAAATRVQVDGGRISSVENDTFPQGTRIQVRNLFYNVPARREFLKSIASEMAQISDIVCHYMMGYPEIAFKFTKGNVLLAHTTGSGNLAEAILAVYGHETTSSMIELKEPKSLAGSGISVRGFISPPNEPQKAARYMTTLINRRFVKSKILSVAVGKALGSFFPKGRYPVLVLDIRFPGGMVDVNVHPQKTEVRFKDEGRIFRLVCEVLQVSLSGLQMIAPFPQEYPDTPPGGPRHYSSTDREFPSAPTTFQGMFPSFQPSQPIQHSHRKEEATYELQDHRESHGSASLADAGLTPVRSLEAPIILAQLMNSYLLGEDKTGLFILDQHAAHERILFDKYFDAFKDRKVFAQPLLFPIPLKLLPSEAMVLNDHINELEQLGFRIQREDDDQYYASAVPVSVKTDENEAVQNMIVQVLNDWGARSMEDIRIDILKTMACKVAVKAGDPLEPSEMTAILEQLLETTNPFTCPHGRPVVVRLTRRQIDKGFLRT